MVALTVTVDAAPVLSSELNQKGQQRSERFWEYIPPDPGNGLQNTVSAGTSMETAFRISLSVNQPPPSVKVVSSHFLAVERVYPRIRGRCLKAKHPRGWVVQFVFSVTSTEMVLAIFLFGRQRKGMGRPGEILYGNKDRLFKPVAWPTGQSLDPIGDVNGDGRSDVAERIGNGDGVRIFHGGRFESMVSAVMILVSKAIPVLDTSSQRLEMLMLIDTEMCWLERHALTAIIPNPERPTCSSYPRMGFLKLGHSRQNTSSRPNPGLMTFTSSILPVHLRLPGM